MYRLIVIIAFLFVSCDKDFSAPEPDRLIEQEVMEDILFDINLLKASKSKSYKLLKDNKVEADVYIYNKYKIDSITLRQNIAYYASASFKKSKEIENNIKERFVVEKEKVTKAIEVQDSLRGVKAKKNKGKGKRGIELAPLARESKKGLLISDDYTKWRAVYSTIVLQNEASNQQDNAQVLKLIASSNNSQHRIEIPTFPLSGKYEFSIYAKKAEMNIVRLRIGMKGYKYTFDLEKGVVLGNDDGKAEIKKVTDGWFLCTLKCTVKDVHVARVNIFPDDSYNDFTGDGLKGVLFKNPNLRKL